MKLSYSLPIEFRTKCKFCHSSVDSFFYTSSKALSKTIKPKDKKPIIKAKIYSHLNPKDFTHMRFFACSLESKRGVGTRIFQHHKDRFCGGRVPLSYLLMCKCRKTSLRVSSANHRKSSTFLYDKEINMAS